MTPEDPARIAAQLVELRLEHRDLDDAIARLALSIEADELTTWEKDAKVVLNRELRHTISKLSPEAVSRVAAAE